MLPATSRHMTRQILVLAAAVAVLAPACGPGAGVSPLRFHNQAVVWQINDRENVPEKPADRPFVRPLYHTDAPFFHRVVGWMDLHEPTHARNVNALDEVPDSTWFTNRRALTPADIARGPNTTEGPDPSAPWKVVSSKVGGQSVGFIVKDARGDRYLLKFDEPHFPVTETATDVVLQRLLWAVGYNVPEDNIVYFNREDLVIDEKAKISDVFGNKRPMTVADLDSSLAKVRSDNGRFRGLTSKFLPGIPIGGFPQRGVRKDDPNDRVAHEHRRELRGLRIFYSWLQYTDAKENNTLDVYEEDPKDPDRHYVVHYLVDFGKSLGANSSMARYYADGHVHMLDLIDVPLQILTLGLYKRAWEKTHDPGIVGVAMFDVEHYDPVGFVAHDPYEPFKRMQDTDAYWATRILVKLSPAHVRAGVEQGKYPDPAGVDYLTEVLVGRQRKAARAWFDRVAPLDEFRLDGDKLCFKDLYLTYRIAAPDDQVIWPAGATAPSGPPNDVAGTRYAATSFDYNGQKTSWSGSAEGKDDGSVCLGGVQPGPSNDGYVMVRVDLTRGKTFDPVVIHLAQEPGGGALRIIGIRHY